MEYLEPKPSPDAVFVMASGIAERQIRNPLTGQVGHRKTTFGFYDTDSRGASAWGRVRLIGASYLGEKFPETEIVTLSRNFDNLSGQSEATQMAEELRTRYKVENPITERPESMDTFTELVISLGISIEKGWQEVVIVNEETRLGRVHAMLSSLRHLDDGYERAVVERMMRFNARRFDDKIYEHRGSDFEYFRSSLNLLSQNAQDTRSINVVVLPGEQLTLAKSRRYQEAINNVRAGERYKMRKLQDNRAAQDWALRLYTNI